MSSDGGSDKSRQRQTRALYQIVDCCKWSKMTRRPATLQDYFDKGCKKAETTNCAQRMSGKDWCKCMEGARQ